MDPGQGSSQSKEGRSLGPEPEIVEVVTNESKSQGLFEQFRRECHADVDTKPASQNLKQQVETSLEEKLEKLEWQPDTVKNHVTEDIRHQIELDLLEPNLEGMLNQAIHPKVYTEFIPQISDLVYTTLGLEKPDSSNDAAAKHTSNDGNGEVQKSDQESQNNLEPTSFSDTYESWEYESWEYDCYDPYSKKDSSVSGHPVTTYFAPDTGSADEQIQEVAVSPEPEKNEAAVQKVGEMNTEAAVSSELVKTEDTVEVDLSSQSIKEQPATNGTKKYTEHKKHNTKKSEPKSHKPEKKKHSKDEKRQSSSEKPHSRDKSSHDAKPKSLPTESSGSHSKNKTESSTSKQDTNQKSQSHHHKDDMSKKRGDDRSSSSSKKRASEEGGKKRTSDSGKKNRANDGNTKKQHGEDGGKKRGNDEGSRTKAHDRHASKESGHSSSSSSSHHDSKEGKCVKEHSGKMNPEDEKKQAFKEEKDQSENNRNSDKSETNSDQDNPEVANKPVSEQAKVGPSLHKPIIAENFPKVRKIIKLRKHFMQQEEEMSKQEAAESDHHEEEEPKLSTQEFSAGEVEDKPAKRQKLQDKDVLPEVEVQADSQNQTEKLHFFEPAGDRGVTPLLPVVASLEGGNLDNVSFSSVESDDDEDIVLELSESDALIVLKFFGRKVDDDSILPTFEESLSEPPQSSQESKLPSNMPKHCIDGEDDLMIENSVPASATDGLKSQPTGKNKKKKRGQPEKDNKDAAEIGQSSHSSYILIPTSPTDNVLVSDSKSKKKQEESVYKPSNKTAPHTSTTKVRGRGKRVNESRAGGQHQHQQRYESCDLYKPRPTVTPSRRMRESAAAAATKGIPDENNGNK